MIGKLIRGTNVARLLCYLYGPGKANEHTDPHLVAGFSDPADLEPRIRANGTRDFRRLTGLLAQPLAALVGSGYPQPVWHCSVRSAPEDRMLSDHEWAQVAARVMDRTGLAQARSARIPISEITASRNANGSSRTRAFAAASGVNWMPPSFS